MPMYTYYCNICNTEVEKIRPISDRDHTECDVCRFLMIRQIDKPGMVWSPTKSGGNHS